MVPKIDLMLDLETLDTKPGATVLSIGAAFFNRATAVIEGLFYVEVNIESQLPLHTTVSADTMDFWQRTNPKWIEKVMSTEYQKENTIPVSEALMELDAWVQDFYLKFDLGSVWAQGQDFDFPILAELYNRVRNGEMNAETGSFLPWPFWLHRDTRTAYDISGFNAHDVKRNGTHHNALDDCLHQIKCLHMALNNFRPFSKVSPAELERLAMLAEEAGEIVQMVGKTLRHGYESFHPDNPGITNRGLLENEIADLHAVQLIMEEKGDIENLSPQASDAVGHAMEKKAKYTHHQQTVPDAKA